MASAYTSRFNMEEPADPKDWARIKTHLREVYTLLGVAMLIATAGCYLQIVFARTFQGLPLIIASALGFAGVLGVNGVFGAKYRGPSFMAMAFSTGFMLGPLMNIVLELNAKIAFYALFGAFGIFAALTFSAIFAKNKRYLMLGGILSASLSILFWVNLASMFFPTRFNYNLQLYGGLVLFCGYVLFDTQRIIAQVQMYEANDPVQDAAKLFMNLTGIIRRILIILAKKEEENKRRKQRRE
mmetsp:Transcript_5775/g.17228  ORF Transcript_5775/g.17228 Transcript_5775/m.17228 type:complete len:241 (-) Transcript_5775:126-848(-)